MAHQAGDSPFVDQVTDHVLYGPGCNGLFEPHERFYKFVSPIQWYRSEDRPSSSAFRRERESVNWEALSSPESTVAGRPGYGVVSVSAKLCIRLRQKIEYTPVKDHPEIPDNPAHCDVVGHKPERTVARKFAISATLWIRPTLS